MGSARQQFICFCLVGTAGFVVDGGVLVLLLTYGADAHVGRAVSFPIAVIVTWYLNRNWTFAAVGRGNAGRRLYRYFTCQFLAVLANYAFYALVLMFLPHVPINALFALGVGSVVGLGINFSCSKYVVFRPEVTADRSIQ